MRFLVAAVTAPADVVHTLVSATCDNNTHITLVHLSLVISHSDKVVRCTLGDIVTGPSGKCL